MRRRCRLRPSHTLILDNGPQYTATASVLDAQRLCRTGMVTQTQLETAPYLALRRVWGKYRCLRDEHHA